VTFPDGFTKPITSWYRVVPGADFQGRLEFNHVQDGHLNTARPEGHPNWKNGRWVHDHLYWSKETNRLHFKAHCCFTNPTPEGPGSFEICNGIFDNDPKGRKWGVGAIYDPTGTLYWLEIRKRDVVIERWEYSLLEVLEGSFDPESIKRKYFDENLRILDMREEKRVAEQKRIHEERIANIKDDPILVEVVRKVVREELKIVADYQKGNEKALNALVGKVIGMYKKIGDADTVNMLAIPIMIKKELE
jgi:hypothetical protein